MLSQESLPPVAPDGHGDAPARLAARRSHTVAGWACAVAVVLAFVLIHPVVEMGVCDDWSYVRTAQTLANTGHLVYNGWATAMLGAQVYLGALFMRLFGPTYLAARLSTMFFAVLSAPVAYAVLSRFGVRTWNATFGTLALVLSPLFLSLGSSFMSDSLAMFFFLCFLYCTVRCVTARGSALGWLCLATAAGLLGGSVRQIIWMAPLVALPCIAWQQRRRRHFLSAGIALWMASAVTVFLCIRWFHAQPYISAETSYVRPRSLAGVVTLLGRIVRGLDSCLLLLWPVLTGLAVGFARRRERAVQVLAMSAAVVLVVTLTTIHNGGAWWGTWLLDDYVTTSGVLFLHELRGLRPTLIPGALQPVLAAAVLWSALLGFAALWTSRERPLSDVHRWTRDPLFWTAVPFTLVYLALLYTRATSYDRYYLPLMFLATVALLRWQEQSGGGRVSRWAMLPLALLAIYAVAGVHDQFAASRARLTAADQLQAAGIPKTEFSAGFEFDGITQIDITGYVNEPRLLPHRAFVKTKTPAGLLQARPSSAYPWHQSRYLDDNLCFSWFRGYTPSIHAKYQLASEPNYCFTDAPIAPVRYRTWLPPHAHAIYTESIPEQHQ